MAIFEALISIFYLNSRRISNYMVIYLIFGYFEFIVRLIGIFLMAFLKAIKFLIDVLMALFYSACFPKLFFFLIFFYLLLDYLAKFLIIFTALLFFPVGIIIYLLRLWADPPLPNRWLIEIELKSIVLFMAIYFEIYSLSIELLIIEAIYWFFGEKFDQIWVYFQRRILRKRFPR